MVGNVGDVAGFGSQQTLGVIAGAAVAAVGLFLHFAKGKKLALSACTTVILLLVVEAGFRVLDSLRLGAAGEH